MKLGYVASLRHGENDRLVLPFRGKVFLQPKSKEAGLRAHNAVVAHVVALRAAEDLCADALFLDRIAPPLLLLLANEAKKAGKAVRLAKKRGRENPVEEKSLLLDGWPLFNAAGGGDQCGSNSPVPSIFHSESPEKYP